MCGSGGFVVVGAVGFDEAGDGFFVGGVFSKELEERGVVSKRSTF